MDPDAAIMHGKYAIVELVDMWCASCAPLMGRCSAIVACSVADAAGELGG